MPVSQRWARSVMLGDITNYICLVILSSRNHCSNTTAFFTSIFTFCASFDGNDGILFFLG